MEHYIESDHPHIAAFMDIGTNSVRLLVVRVEAKQAYRILTDQKETVRLGESEFIDQRLQPKAMQRAVLICANFANMARSHGADEIVAVATAAVREAENKNAFLRRLQQAAGLDVHVVSGMEEARLIYLGVSSGVHLGEKTALFIDIGGGSTEIIVGSQQQHHFLGSLKLGAIRVSSLFLPDPSAPVSPDLYAFLLRNVRIGSVRIIQQVQKYRIDLAIGSSGTIQNLAALPRGCSTNASVTVTTCSHSGNSNRSRRCCANCLSISVVRCRASIPNGPTSSSGVQLFSKR